MVSQKRAYGRFKRIDVLTDLRRLETLKPSRPRPAARRGLKEASVTGGEETPIRSPGAARRRLGPAFLLAASLLAVSLFGRGSADQTAVSAPANGPARRKDPSGWLFLGASAFPIALALAAIGLYAASGGKSVAASALLVSAGAFAAGGALGFLFGVPHVVAAATSTTGEPVLRSSSHLEEIADWLTKILVGLGLVELGKIIASGTDFLDFLNPAFGGEGSGSKDSSGAVALADVTFFAVTGFIALYYITRVFVTPALKQVEDDLSKKVESLKGELKETQQTVAREREALDEVRKQRGANGEPPPG
jgi:hypothetical protein